jgi:hypothetical protein
MSLSRTAHYNNELLCINARFTMWVLDYIFKETF